MQINIGVKIKLPKYKDGEDYYLEQSNDTSVQLTKNVNCAWVIAVDSPACVSFLKMATSGGCKVVLLPVAW